MTREESDGIVSYIAAIYGLRPTDQTRTAWWDQIGDLPADAAMDAVRAVMREQDSRSWPLISHIRAKVLAEKHPSGISPPVRHAKGCGLCTNGIVIAARAGREEFRHQVYQYAYRCRCAAGRDRPEKYPMAPDWALEEPPGFGRVTAAEAQAAVSSAVRAAQPVGRRAVQQDLLTESF